MQELLMIPPENNGDLAELIDYTLLVPEATEADIRRACEEARQYGFRSVCVSSGNVRLAARLLKGSLVMAICVIGFPHGDGLGKIDEARHAIAAGAAEIDVVVNLGWVKDRKTRLLKKELRLLVAFGRPVKLIIETAKLTDREKIYICRLAARVGVAFVKTSSGFQGGGATVEDVLLMRRAVGSKVRIKASGKVSTAKQARELLVAGADCLGCGTKGALGIVNERNSIGTEGAATDPTY